MNDVPDTLEDGIMETLDYLKTHGHSLAVLTNWYGRTQIPRLKKADMFQYFDDIYTGDVILKPHKEAYLFARKDFDSDDCIFVGDNVDKDYIGPRACGMKSLLYDKNEKYHSSIQKIKKMNELIKISCDK
jgi:putative hydrolase of the HAD superfamily